MILEKNLQINKFGAENFHQPKQTNNTAAVRLTSH